MTEQTAKYTRLDFGQSIVGFENLRYFQLTPFEGESSFSLLQSEEDANIGFIVVSPFEMYPNYEFQLKEEVIGGLKINHPEEVAVYTSVTVKKPFHLSTTNLFAPFVINVNTGESRQVLLENTVYSVHSPLFPNGMEGIADARIKP